MHAQNVTRVKDFRSKRNIPLGEVEKTFNQVFFMLLYIIIYTKLANFCVKMSYFVAEMTGTSTLGAIYGKLRIFWNKRTSEMDSTQKIGLDSAKH